MSHWHFWAKVDNNRPEQWHALPWHLYEVGAIAKELWHRSLTDHARNRLSTRLRLTPEMTGRWIGFLAALHDFGKASPRFQSMVPSQVDRLLSIPELDFRKDLNTTALRHSLISFGLLESIFQEQFGWNKRTAREYAAILAAHHGRFWNSNDFEILKSFDNVKRTGITTWHHHHLALFGELREAFQIDDDLATHLGTLRNGYAGVPTYEDSLWMSGLISVADWLGSDVHFFPFNTEPANSPREALALAQDTAKQALVRTGWASPPLKIDATSFNTVNIGLEARKAQIEGVELVHKMTSPGLTVVEFPMGWGKTELALWIAAHYAEAFQVSGIYFALPTMATSDQLYERVSAHLRRHALETEQSRIVPLHLLHGMADLSAHDEILEPSDNHPSLDDIAEGLESLGDPDSDPSDPADRDNVVRRARWFTRKKRGLLARYGVGTVDQALMSVLLTPHFFVRLFGLSGKTIVFDEVHSYDVYMNELFDQLLEFLGAMGSPVVILSATLPGTRTQEMLEAYARGADWKPAVSDLAAYPRISAVDDTQSRSITVNPTTMGDPMKLHLEWKPGDEASMWQDLSKHLQTELQDGGTVAVICNTVRCAQECFQQLAQVFAEDELTLFHARFRQKDRARIQKLTLERFGKEADQNGNVDRPFRHIVIATQVIEQSLDLDFDLMVSMFAPTDLLLQRAGRLQRHGEWDNSRPARFRNRARLWLIGYQETSSPAQPEFHAGSQRVYGEYVLLRSWLALSGRSQIVIPNDVESLIEETYGDQGDVPTHLESRIHAARKQWINNNQIQVSQSNAALIPNLHNARSSVRTSFLLRLGGIKLDPEDVPNAHISRLSLTRLGPRSISLVVVSNTDIIDLGFDPRDEERDEFMLSEIRDLLRHAVSVTDNRLVSAAGNLPTLPAWEKSAHLRYSRLIVIEPGERYPVGEVIVRLDDKLGLVIERTSGSPGRKDS